jgi:hypothetical protein
MTTILSSTILEIKLLTRSIWTYGAIISLGVYITLGFPQFITQDDPGRALMGSAYVVVGGMILSLIWGYTSVNREKFSFLHETIQSYENGWRTTVIAKLLSLIAGLFFVYLFSLSILIIRFAWADVPTDFWTLAFPYLLLYWILPFVVSGIIGMNVGLLTGESKISYLLIFIVWVLFSPLATVLIDFPYNEWISKALSVLQLFNIGQSSMFTPFDPVYGLPLETYRWWKVLFWLSLSSATLYILLIPVHSFFGSFVLQTGFQSLFYACFGFMLITLIRNAFWALGIVLFYASTQILTKGNLAPWVNIYLFHNETIPSFPDLQPKMLQAFVLSFICILVGQIRYFRTERF